MAVEKIVIFTDLDGTLLDHDTYSFEEADEMLGFIKKQNIPLIIVTSKTKEEVLHLVELLGLKTPFIVENGAGIFVPDDDAYKMIPMGFDYDYVRSCFVEYKKSISMTGFDDMNNRTVASYTGLPVRNAMDAKKRNFTEPFILDDESQLEALNKMASEDGLDVVRGGRFYHLITKDQDKASAIEYLVKEYEKESGATIKSIALGDSANDLSMLQSVNVPVLIPHPDGSYMECEIDKVIKAPYPGSKGWNAALKEYFDVK